MRRVKAALSQWVQVPPGNLLQPEATGATVEVTKRLKLPVKRAANMVATLGNSVNVWERRQVLHPPFEIAAKSGRS